MLMQLFILEGVDPLSRLLAWLIIDSLSRLFHADHQVLELLHPLAVVLVLEVFLIWGFSFANLLFSQLFQGLAGTSRREIPWLLSGLMGRY